MPTSSTHRQGARRVDATDRGVQRELADRDAHAADAEVAETEDALAVGDDDDVDAVAAERVVEQFGNAVLSAQETYRPCSRR